MKTAAAVGTARGSLDGGVLSRLFSFYLFLNKKKQPWPPPTFQLSNKKRLRKHVI
jgi:hypothetical protein